MSDFKDYAWNNPEFRDFLRKHPSECLDVVIWAAFGFGNNAEREAVALLHEYNTQEKKM